MNRYLISLLFAIAAPALAATKPYHLELEAYPAAPFPYFSKFGSVDLHVYSGGVRADSFWLKGFSRNGSKTITAMNPVLRMYTEVPLADITSIVGKLASSDQIETSPPAVQGPMRGRVGVLRASRYRLVYGPTAWIDLWTTADIPPNQQLRNIVDSLINGISPSTAKVARAIPGTPVYVELNFRRFRKVALVKFKKLTFNNAGETAALKVGTLYFKAPLLDAIWR
ncbi:MAG TPA: hypothetical protein VGK04_06360 [Thermoanaerobaculia bacterium]|jgi:hypothetical protein